MSRLHLYIIHGKLKDNAPYSFLGDAQLSYMFCVIRVLQAFALLRFAAAQQGYGHAAVKCLAQDSRIDVYSPVAKGTVPLPYTAACQTVCGRYRSARYQLPHYSTSAHTHGSREVVLLTTWEGADFTPELITHVRSLIVESWPRHVRIMYHCTDIDSCMKKLPTAFHPYAYPFTAKDVETFYLRSTGQKGSWDVKVLSHLPAMMFMEGHPRFSFAWVLEDDVRLIGDWNDLFNNAMQHTKQQLGLDEADPLATPDLILFDQPCIPDRKWYWRKEAIGIPNKMKQKALLVVYGFSKRAAGTMHVHHMQGHSAYFELFAPSIARMSKLAVGFAQHPLYGDVEKHGVCKQAGSDARTLQDAAPFGGTFHWDRSVALDLYNLWLSRNYCQRPVLLHPVKAKVVQWNTTDGAVKFQLA